MRKRLVVLSIIVVAVGIAALVGWRLIADANKPYSPPALNENTDQRQIRPFKPGPQPYDGPVELDPEKH